MTNLPLEELIGSLMIHEITVNSHQEVDDKKRKSITLEASTIEEKVDEENDSKKDEIQKSSRNL